MDTAAAIKEFVKTRPAYCKIGKVTRVGDTTCEVTLVEDENSVFEHVRLKAHLQGDRGIVIKPKVGSFVVIDLISKTDAFVAIYDEVDSVSIKLFDHQLLLDSNGLTVDVSKGKFTIKNTEEDLKTWLNDLVSEILKITVTTGTGPSGTPINVPQFQQIAQRLPKLFT